MLFAQIDAFAARSALFPDETIVALLNQLFGVFDEICVRCGVFKVETICEVRVFCVCVCLVCVCD